MSESRDLHLPEGVTLEEGQGGRPVLRVSTPQCTGEVYLDGATVTGWTPAGVDNVLFLSEESRFEQGRVIRGGAVLCAPWFANGRNGDRSPAHGFIRTSPWEPATVVAGEDTVTLVLDFPPHATPPEYAEARFRFTVVFGEELLLTLSVTAGDHEVDLEAAIHTYFSVRDIASVRIEGLDEVPYWDKVRTVEAVQSGPVTFDGEVDRVYHSTAPVRLVDEAAVRALDISTEGASKTVVWNIGQEKATAFDDLGDDEWRRYVCVEAADALDGFVLIEPGQTHDLVQRISLG